MDRVEPLKPKLTLEQGHVWMFLDIEYVDWTPEKFAKKHGYKRNIKYIRDNWDNMIGMLNELISLGINYADIHVDNLGVNKNGDIIYFDAVGKYTRNQIKYTTQEFETVDISPFFKETMSN